MNTAFKQSIMYPHVRVKFKEIHRRVLITFNTSLGSAGICRNGMILCITSILSCSTLITYQGRLCSHLHLHQDLLMKQRGSPESVNRGGRSGPEQCCLLLGLLWGHDGCGYGRVRIGSGGRRWGPRCKECERIRSRGRWVRRAQGARGHQLRMRSDGRRVRFNQHRVPSGGTASVGRAQNSQGWDTGRCPRVIQIRTSADPRGAMGGEGAAARIDAIVARIDQAALQDERGFARAKGSQSIHRRKKLQHESAA